MIFNQFILAQTKNRIEKTSIVVELSRGPKTKMTEEKKLKEELNIKERFFHIGIC